jgi:hypothetical protein
VEVEDALGARKFCGAGACNGTLDPDLTLATIRQAQPGATLDEIHRRRGFLEPPRPGRIGTPGGAADRLDNAVALDYGRALADRRGAVVAILDPHTIDQAKGPGGEPNAEDASHDPARSSRYASSPPPTRGSFGRGSQHQGSISMPISGKGAEAARDHHGLVDRRLVAFLEVARQPSRGDARMPARILPRDQHRQLERILEAERWQLLRRRLGDEQVPVLDCAAEDRVRPALRGRRSSFLGAERLVDPNRRRG